LVEAEKVLGKEGKGWGLTRLKSPKARRRRKKKVNLKTVLRGIIGNIRGNWGVTLRWKICYLGSR